MSRPKRRWLDFLRAQLKAWLYLLMAALAVVALILAYRVYAIMDNAGAFR